MKKWALLALPVMLLSFLLPEQQNNNSIKNMDNNTLLNDGPYVLYTAEKVFVKSFTEENGNKILKQDSLFL